MLPLLSSGLRIQDSRTRGLGGEEILWNYSAAKGFAVTAEASNRFLIPQHCQRLLYANESSLTLAGEKVFISMIFRKLETI